MTMPNRPENKLATNMMKRMMSRKQQHGMNVVDAPDYHKLAFTRQIGHNKPRMVHRGIYGY